MRLRTRTHTRVYVCAHTRTTVLYRWDLCYKPILTIKPLIINDFHVTFYVGTIFLQILHAYFSLRRRLMVGKLSIQTPSSRQPHGAVRLRLVRPNRPVDTDYRHIDNDICMYCCFYGALGA